MTTNLSITTLYDQDYYLWVETTAQLLRERKLAQIDYENLIEEIEDMGNSQKDSLESNLRVLLMHLLKYKYQTSKRSNSWLFTIVEHRKRILKAFKRSPSFKRYFTEVFDESYADSIDLAVAETGLARATFPEQCPFSQDDVLNPTYLPD